MEVCGQDRSKRVFLEIWVTKPSSAPGNGAWALTVKKDDQRDPEVRIHGKLFIEKLDQLQSSDTRYMVRKLSTNEIGWYDSSDQALKKDIQTVPAAVGKIQQLRGVSFHWNETGLEHKTRDVEENIRSMANTPEDNEKLWDWERERIIQENSRRFYGFIAQEVETVFPDWVKTDEAGYKTINMDELTPVMVEAIKSQQQEIDTLKAQVALLVSKVDALSQK
jgi:hypothetical protein